MNPMDSSNVPSPPLRILSLDGGGIRGKSSLLILENIMERIRESKGLDRVPRPCEYFDLIGGTSTGGIIAIMLGRLGMTVDECIRAYENVGRAAFTPKRTLLPIAPPKGAFSATALEGAIKHVVQEHCTEPTCVTQRRQGRPTADTCPHSDLRLRDATCTKTAVLAITKANIDTGPTLFTTYDSSTTFQDCTIWQVARATSAATTFFKSIELGRDRIEFIDAGFGYNNPCEVLINEAKKQFPGRRELQVLTIGTGLGDVVEIQDSRRSILNALKKMASSSTAVANRLGDQYGDGGQYHRFNVERGLVDVALSDWQQTSKISAHTNNYLRENERAIRRFVDALLHGPERQQVAVSELSSGPRLGNVLKQASRPPSRVISLPSIRNKNFTGRAAKLEELQKKLFLLRDCQKLAIVGLGGVGKTQLALQFAHWVREKYPDYSICWLPVLSVEGFNQAYLDIGKKYVIHIDREKENPNDTIRKHLSSEEAGKWLLIVDNADDVGMVLDTAGIYDYLPESETGLMIFTTRSIKIGLAVAGTDLIELHEMDEAEARDLLEKSLFRKQPNDEGAVAEFLRELTYLPLAITQAAAYLNQNQVSIKRYLKLLHQTEQNLVDLMSKEFRDNTRYRGSQNAVATTWLVSFDQIQISNSTAAKLLSFISCIEPKSIPRSLLSVSSSEVEITEAIGTLLGYAFLVDRGDGDIYDIHSLVHLATRIWLQKKQRTEETILSALQHLEAVFPLNNRANRLKWQSYVPHAFRLLNSSKTYRVNERFDLFYMIGRCLNEDRRFKDVVRCYEEVVRWRRAILLETDDDRLASEHSLASAYLTDRRIPEAIKILEHVVEVQKTTLDEKDHDRLASEHALATAYLNARRISKAIEILEHVVEVQKTTLDEKDHFRLASEHELARAYLNDRRIPEAIEIFEHVVEVQKTTLDEKDHFRLASEHELASAYLTDRRIPKAIKMLEHVVEVQKTTLDEKDHSRLTSEHALASAYLTDRRIPEAIKMLEHVVEVQKTTLDEKDHDRLASEHSLATAYLNARRISKAIEIFEHVVEVRKTTLDEKDHSRLTSEHALATAYLNARRISKAIEIFEHVVEVQKTTLDETDDDRLASEHSLASAYLDDRRIPEAIEIFEHVVEVRKTTLDEKDHDRLASEHELATAYLDDSQAQKAVDLLEHIVAVESQLFDEDDPDRHISLELLEDARQQLEAEWEPESNVSEQDTPSV